MKSNLIMHGLSCAKGVIKNIFMETFSIRNRLVLLLAHSVAHFLYISLKFNDGICRANYQESAQHSLR